MKKPINIYVFKEMKYILGRKHLDNLMLEYMTEDQKELVMRRIDNELNLGLYDEYETTFFL